MDFFSHLVIAASKPGRLCHFSAAVLVMLACTIVSAQEKLVITVDDFVRPVGAYDIYTATGSDGTVLGELKAVVEERMDFGTTRIMKVRGMFNGNRGSETWVVVTRDRIAYYASDSSSRIQRAYPLPMEVGKTYTYEIGDMTHVVRVIGEETITTPAGTFKCLVSSVTEDGVPTGKVWLAPGPGSVQIKGIKPQPFTMTLKESKNPKALTPPPGWDLFTNYEPGSDPDGVLFPNVQLNSFGKGITEPEFDASEGAQGTAGSLRWSYYVEPGDWVQGGAVLTGGFDKTFDLSKYDQISFYIKGFRPGKCGLIINGAADTMHPKPWTILPLQYTSEWQKVTFNLADHDFSTLDVRKVQSMSLSHLGSEEAKGDVVWMDELTGHRKKATE